jgi:hypothetical protein
MAVLALGMAAVRAYRMSLDLRLPHVSQVCTQSGLYVYGMLYYPAVIQHLPTVAAHLGLGVAADAFICVARFRSRRVGLSAVPVVLDVVAAVIVGERTRLRGTTGGFVAAQWKSLAPRVERADAFVRRPLPTHAFVVVWLLICASWLRVEKPLDFEPALHVNNGNPLAVSDPGGVPRCASNPVFCRPFAFPQEAAMWWRRLRAAPGAR